MRLGEVSEMCDNIRCTTNLPNDVVFSTTTVRPQLLKRRCFANVVKPSDSPSPPRSLSLTPLREPVRVR